MLRNALTVFSSAAWFAISGANAVAAVSAEEAARLGQDLTPQGAEMAANADGTIPAWTGGITSPPAGFEPRGHHPDPYADDAVSFTITAANMAEHADKLTEGHKAMLSTYPDYRMHVYPTRRSFAAPQRIYDATRENAARAVLTEGGNGAANAAVGTPFPIPATGVEVVWNHILRWRAVHILRKFGLAAVTRSGKYTLVEFEEPLMFSYAAEGQTPDSLNNLIGYFKQQITAPARLAGRILLVHETLDQNKERRKAWVYNPGQRRVRRAPNVAFDNPKEGADGLTTSDTLDMYNGSPERYEWKLVGKKEMYVPYNSYKLDSPDLEYSDILKPLHMNPEHLRYELHRVWIVDGTLRDGTDHVYKRRTFYVDEDSWQIVVMDQYDKRDQLWRVSEGHGINYYEVPNYWTTVEVHHDLQSRRYVAIGLTNETDSYAFDVEYSERDFSPSALRRAGIR